MILLNYHLINVLRTIKINFHVKDLVIWKFWINAHSCILMSIFSGPDKWGDDFPVANGPRQSPIDIVPKEVQYDSTLKALKLKYDPSNAKGILNNGHSFQVDFVDDTDSSSKHSSSSVVRRHAFMDLFTHHYL